MHLAEGDSVVAVATTNGKKLDPQNGNGNGDEAEETGSELDEVDALPPGEDEVPLADAEEDESAEEQDEDM
jgi:hypothetical protein